VDRTIDLLTSSDCDFRTFTHRDRELEMAQLPSETRFVPVGRRISLTSTGMRHLANQPRFAGLVLLIALLPACQSDQMDAATPCRDFLQATRDDQDAAIARVADEFGTGNALTPLGRPNIDYVCSMDQDRTLGQAVQMTG
jgi:hypothetical protein